MTFKPLALWGAAADVTNATRYVTLTPHTRRIAEVQRRRWKAFRGVARLSQIPSKPEHGRTIPLPDIDAWSARPSPLIDCVINSLALAPNRLMSSSTMRKWIL